MPSRGRILKVTSAALFVLLFLATQLAAEFLYRSSWVPYDKAFGAGQEVAPASSERIAAETALKSLQLKSVLTIGFSGLALAVTLFLGLRGGASAWPSLALLAAAAASCAAWLYLGLSIMDGDVSEQRPYALYLRVLFTTAWGASLAAAGLEWTSRRPRGIFVGGVALAGSVALSFVMLSLDWV
jgi:hypothetical protein